MNLPPALLRLVERQWRRGGWLASLLAPLSAVTALAVRRKRARYASGRRRAYRPAVPVVVIGNIYVGGTGKTPVVIATVQALRQRGWNPGVVSRGYGVRLDAGPRVGRGALDPAEYGDEPALIARASGAPIGVHPHRAQAARALLQAHPDVDVLVSDDGLQHLALARDLEIVVQDERGVGNGRLLPAGPLREPPERLAEADLVITRLASPPRSAAAVPDAAPTATRHIQMWLQPAAVRRLVDGEERRLADFSGPLAGRVAAAAGIGQPARFFETLRQAGIELRQTLALPDHHAYAGSPFAGLDADHILITAKDAVKCARLGDARLWSVEVSACFSDPGYGDWVSQRLREAADRLAAH
ncbi:tetraacyldisaccharide 4'-kinase [Bordetella sp. 2513F-2]